MGAKQISVASAISKKIAWSQLKDFYEGQWVELVDYQWNWKQPYPSWGTVRHYASDRSELLQLIRSDKPISESVVLFIGSAHSTFEHSLSAAV